MFQPEEDIEEIECESSQSELLAIMKGLWVFNNIMSPVPKGIQLNSKEFSQLKDGPAVPDKFKGKSDAKVQRRIRAISTLSAAVKEQVFVFRIEISSLNPLRGPKLKQKRRNRF